MIDKKSIEAYRHIKAPEPLRDRVLAVNIEKEQEPRHKRPVFLKTVASVAACLILVAGISVPMLQNQQKQGLFLNGSKIGSSPAAVTREANDFALARMQQGTTILLDLKEHAATVMVSDGTLQVRSKKDELQNEGKTVTVEGEARLNWLIEEAVQADLTVTTKKAVKIYEMYQDEASEKYYIRLKETEKL